MYYAARANTWAVMTDELQVARLATSIAEDLSLVPTIHGVYYGAHSQLYPLLLAPFYGTLDGPEAAAAAHALNALLLVSAAVPAFLLGRAVGAARGAGYVAAILTAVTPWLVLSSTLLTENAAYAAFTWSVFLCRRAIVRPGTGTDLAALGGLVLAYSARTQLFVLALALPAAVVLNAVGMSLRRGDVRATVRRAIAEHRVLTVAYGAGFVVAGLLAATGHLAGAVGNYALPFAGDLVPAGFWSSAVAHFDQVALGVGVVPVVLCASWLITTVVHPESRDGYAFAALVLALGPLLIVEVTSFDLRFTPEQFIQDRYLVYLVPLFAVGCAAWLTQRTHVPTRLISAAGAAAAVALLLRLAPDEDTVIFWASPAAAFRPALLGVSSALHLSVVTFLQIATVLSVLAIIALAWRAPRVALVATAVAVGGFGALQAGYVLERYVEPAMVRPSTGVRDWIDAVPGARSVVLVPGGAEGPTTWWETELWNKDVERVLRVDDGDVFAPFPTDDAVVDFDGGRLAGPQPSDYLVVAASETRFGLVDSAKVASSRSLRLVRVRRPYRLAWATRGLTTDGWSRPGRPATVRLFSHGRAESRTVSLTLAASRLTRGPVGFAFSSPEARVEELVYPGGARPPVELTVCVPAGGYMDLVLLSRRRTLLEEGGVVSLHVDDLTVSDPAPCSAR